MVASTSTTSRRDDLLRAAGEQFVAQGIRDTTMEDIAAAAGAGKATLYRYFANKDAVIDALLDEQGDRLERRLERARTEAGGGLDGLRQAFVVGVRFLTQHPVLRVGREEEPALVLERVLARQGPMIERSLDFWANAITQATAAGATGRVDARVAAEVIVRLSFSYFLFPRMVLDVTDDEQMDLLAREVVDRGLGRR